MAVYWMTEAVPLAVTSIMPVFLFPLLGVLPASDVAINYMKAREREGQKMDIITLSVDF